MTYTADLRPDFGLPWPRYELRDANYYAAMSESELIQEAQNKLTIEANALQDMNQFGWTLDSWREVMENWGNYTTHCIFGGNRSSKSIFCSRLMVYLLLTIPEARIRVYHVNDEKSIAEQQQIIWEALPERYKTMSKRKGINHSIVFSQKTGFTGNKLILPPMPGYSRGSEMIFGTYEQYKNNPQVVEGWWAHAIWGDEEMPQKMYERLLTRLYDAKGRLVLSFTTIQGWSPLVADIIGRTRTLKKRYSDLLKREIPVAQESLSRANTRIYYFWTQDNPFIPSDAIEALRGRPVEEVLSVAHGIPTKPAAGKFPRFDDTLHIIKHEDLPWLQEVKEGHLVPEFTRYCVIDPSGSKPWAIGWFAVGANKVVYLYREWPDVSYGEWAQPSSSLEGKPGPAQRPNGWGINDYVELLRHSEEGETIFERLIDPRLGAALTQAKEGATSIISELEEAGVSVTPAPGLMIDHGLQLINNLLAYDANKPISSLNTPHFFISDRCEQTIYAMKNYTAAGGAGEACKDFIDLPRYLFEHGADFIGKDMMKDRGVAVPY